MTIDAILFDLDNTLYPASAGLAAQIDARILDYLQRALEIGPEEAQELRRTYFATYGTTLRGLQVNYAGRIDAEAYLAHVHDLAFEAFLSSDAELDRLLGELRGRKAIFTNSPAEHARAVLRTLGIERHFEQIFDIRFQEFRPKPDELGYRRALEALGAPPERTAMVEDTAANLVTARRLAMTTVLVREGPPAPGAGLADYHVPDILAALRVIRDLQAGGKA